MFVNNQVYIFLFRSIRYKRHRTNAAAILINSQVLDSDLISTPMKVYLLIVDW